MTAGAALLAKGRLGLRLLSDPAGGVPPAYVFAEQQAQISLGSLEAADVCLLSFLGVDPIHAVIERVGEKVQIFDLASDSGLWVNGKKEVFFELKEGDLLRLGEAELEIFWEAGETKFPSEDLSTLLLEDPALGSQLFKSRGEEASTIEMVFSWGPCVLEVRHGCTRPLSLGSSRRADWTIPFAEDRWVWIRPGEAGQVRLDFHPSMTGVLAFEGRRQAIEQLTQKTQYVLKKTETCKILLGAVQIFLRWSPPPPQLKTRRSLKKDHLWWQVFSAVGVLGIVGGWLLKVPQSAEEKVSPPPLRPVEVTLNQLEVLRNQEPVEKTSLQEASSTPVAQSPSKKSEPPRKSHPPARHGLPASSHAPKKTAVSPSSPRGSMDLLQGLGGLVAGSSFQASAKDPQKLLRHTERAEPVAGVFQSPSKETAAEALWDSTERVTLKKVATGSQARGSGKAISGGGQGLFALQADAFAVRGGGARVNRQAISQVILDHQDEFRWCYEKEINAGFAQLSGQVRLQFVIGPRGRVERATVETSSLKHPPTEACLLQVMQRLSFPQPPSGEKVEVHFPFQFQADGG